MCIEGKIECSSGININKPCCTANHMLGLPENTHRVSDVPHIHSHEDLRAKCGFAVWRIFKAREGKYEIITSRDGFDFPNAVFPQKIFGPAGLTLSKGNSRCSPSRWTSARGTHLLRSAPLLLRPRSARIRLYLGGANPANLPE